MFIVIASEAWQSRKKNVIVSVIASEAWQSRKKNVIVSVTASTVIPYDKMYLSKLGTVPNFH